MPRLIIIFYLLASLGPAWGQASQFDMAPMNPDFLYEKRFIPGNEKIDALETSGSVVDVQEGGDKGQGSSINLVKNLPNLTQSIVIIAVIIIFILYRMQVKKKQSMRRRR